MQQTDPQIKIRMPPPLKAWLKTRAAQNHRAQSTEIVFLLETIMNAETKTAGSADTQPTAL